MKLFTIICLIMLSPLLISCSQTVGEQPPPPITSAPVSQPPTAGSPTATPVPAAIPDLIAETVLEDVGLITAMQFAPDARLFYAEKNGRIFTLDTRGEDSPSPIEILNLPVAEGSESGLLGLALAPNFAQNHQLYVYYNLSNDSLEPQKSRIVRYTERDNEAVEEFIVVDDLPVSPDQLYHFGGGLTIGPDDKLYLIFGDRNMPEAARDPARLEGSILRYNLDGTIPEDNPFPSSPVYATGIRNGFGLAFHPLNGLLYETENGTNCDDELNIIEPGADYGWGLYAWDACPYPDEGAEPPLHQWGRIVAPAGLMFYTSDFLPQFQGDLLVCAHNESQIIHFRLTANGRALREVRNVEIPDQFELCRVTLTQGPDGWIYTATGDHILRIGRH